jgi:NhaP-type Na+/H+ or K+/H+ antiporter
VLFLLLTFAGVFMADATGGFNGLLQEAGWGFMLMAVQTRSSPNQAQLNQTTVWLNSC